MPASEPTVVTAGTYRSRNPEQTLATLLPLLSSFGVTRVADVTWLDDLGIPVYQAIRPMSRNLALSQGKGITRDLAKVSAIMETLESRAAESVPIAVRRVRAEDLGLPYDVGSLARPGYADMARSARLDWCPAMDLSTGRPSFLPVSFVTLDWTLRDRWMPLIFSSTSNGLASGNTPSEAALHGLLEVIERATEDLSTPHEHVELGTIDAGNARALLERIAASDSTIHVRFLPNPWGVAVFGASLRNPMFPRFFGGSGAHLDPDVALCRAISEAVQSRATHIAGSRDDMSAGTYQFTHFGPAEEPPAATITYEQAVAACSVRSSLDIVEDLHRVVAALHGAPILVADLSLAPGVHVAKVVVPSLPNHGHQL